MAVIVLTYLATIGMSTWAYTRVMGGTARGRGQARYIYRLELQRQLRAAARMKPEVVWMGDSTGRNDLAAMRQIFYIPPMSPTTTESRCLPAGTVIFRQGDASHEMFLIAEGRVRIVLDGDGHEQELSVLGPGDFFGELSLLIDVPRTATAVVVEDATLVAIDRDVFAMMMQDDLDIVSRVMNVIGRRLSHADERVQVMRRELERLRLALSRGTPVDPSGE